MLNSGLIPRASRASSSAGGDQPPVGVDGGDADAAHQQRVDDLQEVAAHQRLAAGEGDLEDAALRQLVDDGVGQAVPPAQRVAVPEAVEQLRSLFHRRASLCGRAAPEPGRR